MGYLKHTDFLKRLGNKVKSIREEKGLSQSELASRTELSKNQIGRIERGEVNTGISTIYELSIGLGIPPREFFDKL